ncbi:hypothetical protein [Nostoc piscinale]|uniref:hypothetical protein n=1 Tax=Nostoc piscinale TaxID=224012 RepID=UPI0007854656|nr:hypothetical protein [Nostoc piscinale]
MINEEVPLGEINTLAVPSPQPVEGVAAYTQMGLPPEVETAFDQNQQEVMQNSLSEAQNQVHQVTDERDQARQEQLEHAQTEAEAQTLQADTDQRQAIQEQREQIQTERQNTLQQQSQAVADIEQQSEDQRRSDRDRIDTRVREDQAQIRADYQQAERDAQTEVNGGEQRAEQRRREAEREAENQSWWDRAVSFVREAFEALTSAITAIFDAVRQAVNSILDAVKAAAEALIDAAANFIKEAIAAFGDFLKGLVDNLLGEIFPELAAALNRLIDEAVDLAQQAVDAVAAELKAGINALVEGLRAGLNAVLDVLQAGLEFAINIMQAVLTGDWSALARLVLEAVLKVLGIDPAEFYAFIGQITDTFQAIIDDPGGFVSNLIDAVVLGVQHFADNFLTHLQAGIIGWLTGALGDIQIPQEFNLLGVLDLIRQILGLTGDLIRRIAVRILGERNVERIEFVWNYVQTLITSGWSAFFEQITQDLANLRDMVLEQIKEFLLTQIITAAITKLATLFNPVGAIVQLVLTAWNLYTFLRDNLQNLIQIVQTIVEGLAEIVNGVIEPAAQRVEQVLANLLPVAISFLANLIGIGGIANRVRQIISDLRERIENAIVNLIRRIGQTFRGGDRNTQTPTTPVAETESRAIDLQSSFSMSGARHQIFVQLQEGHLVVEMASERRERLQTLASNLQNDEDVTHLETGQRNEVMTFLNHVLAELRDIAEFERALEVGYSEQTVEQLEARISRVVTALEGAGREFQIQSLHDIETLINRDTELLKTAVESVGILEFMKKMARGEEVNRVNRQIFFEIYSNTDKQIGNKSAREWMQDKFRDVNDKSHEWIPTNLINEIVRRASTGSGFLGGANWIDLQNELRTDTTWVIFKPTISSRKIKINGIDYLVLQGHPGAIYLAGREQVHRSNEFHNNLETAVNSSGTITIAASMDRLKSVFLEWVWKGIDEPLTMSVHPELTSGRDLQLSVPANLSSLQTRQKRNFEQTEQMFDRLKQKYQ